MSEKIKIVYSTVNVRVPEKAHNLMKAAAAKHDTTINHTGSSSTLSITQSGAEASTVDVTTNGSTSSVTINVSD